MHAAVSNIRAGRRLTPKQWPGGARGSRLFSFDVDNETLCDKLHCRTAVEGEYGALEGLPRILALLDRLNIPASFYIPTMSAALHPQMITDILKPGAMNWRSRLGA